MTEKRQQYKTRKQQYLTHLENEQNIMLSRCFVEETIRALLTQVDQWERLLGKSPRNAEIRKMHKKGGN